MTEAAKLMEKYQSANQDASFEVRQALLDFQPQWDKYQSTAKHAGILKNIKLGESAGDHKKILEQDDSVIAQACIDVVNVGDEKLSHWVLTMLYDMLREDSSSFCIFENGNIADKPLRQFLGNATTREYGADKAAWVISAAMGNVPSKFSDAEVQHFLALLVGGNAASCSKRGALEAITNLFKSDMFRKAVWSHQGVADCVFNIQPETDSQEYLYRCVFATWMLSFDSEITADLAKHDVIQKLKSVLLNSRTEKVVRLCLTVLKNLLAVKAISEQIAEEGLLEAVRQLEYEKWRDTELYDEIRDTAQLISTKVQEISNFERYEKELQTGKLHWGFVHSSKFWSENIHRFETNDFRAIKHLAGLLNNFQTDKTTLAICCHDIGEFVTLHPLGKRKIVGLHIKERVMKLMSSADPADREVRREALLCCQKMMLNKWQDIDSSK